MTSRKPRILVIDDDAFNLDSLEVVLSDDYDVELAASGADGLARAERNVPDIVLLDIIMPDMDGFETCRRFKADPALSRVPIVFVTASHETETEVTGLGLGAADFITKPMNVVIARQRIHNLIEREQLRKEVEQQRGHLEELVKMRTVALSIAKEAAETASRAKSTFLATMSNALRTPLHAIMGLTDLVLHGDLPAERRKQLEKIEQASKQLLEVIDNILNFSIIEADQMELELGDFRLGDVFGRLLEIGSYRTGEKGLEFVSEFGELASLSLHGDRKRIEQILLNLIENACKFTNSGRVTLRARMLHDAGDAVHLRFDVADTGIGISRDEQQRIFNAFEHADSFTAARYGGTGLGLAISRRLAKLMEGEIGVDSEPGRGSTFWFVVRLRKSRQALQAASSVTAANAEETLRTMHANARILLVEDEPINQEASRAVLESAGLKVDLATNGVEAVELARRNAYALILMDIEMPKMNGLDATRQIRSLAQNRKTPVVAMSANVFEGSRMRCFAAGINDFIAKPVRAQTLYEYLLKWLKK